MIDYENVEALLPHTGEMVLLDRVLSFDGASLTAEVTVRNDGLLGDGEAVPAWAGIEYMAQAIGAYVGIQALLAGRPIRLGYLLGTRRYTANVPIFLVDTTLVVTVTLVMQDEKLGVFDCTISGDGIMVAGKLNVYQPPTEKYVVAKA